MREIKFRAWDKKEKVFSGPYDIASLCRDRDSLWLQYQEWLQFTGLLDKNGKEIYEGDIVRTYHPFSKFDYNDPKDFIDGEWLAVWEAPAFRFNPTDGRTGVYITKLGGELSEVIGNIYENPNLLKEKSDV